MARLSWDTIRRSLGLPEPETGQDGRGSRAGRERARHERGQGLDMEAAAFAGVEVQPAAGAAAPAAGDGVSIEPMPVTGGQRVTITYEGRLARQGAKGMYLHYGYGPGPWRNVQDVAMTPAGPQRFQASIRVQDSGRLEFCFRDDNGRWDNNDGRNWSCTIHSGGGSLA
ncbi:MAG TPA: carbohydrate-binding protein [Limnochordales bacterium]